MQAQKYAHSFVFFDYLLRLFLVIPEILVLWNWSVNFLVLIVVMPFDGCSDIQMATSDTQEQFIGRQLWQICRVFLHCICSQLDCNRLPG